MTQVFKYHSELLGGSLQVREARIVADLLIRNASETEWKHAIEVENLLQKKSPASAKRVVRTLRSRLESLDSAFWHLIRDGDSELSTQAAFCAYVARDQLLLEYIETIVKDAFITRSPKLDDYHWDEFLDERAHRDPALASLKPSSREKMRTVAHRILTEVGLLENTKTMALKKLLVRSEIKALLEETGRIRILACLNVSGN